MTSAPGLGSERKQGSPWAPTSWTAYRLLMVVGRRGTPRPVPVLDPTVTVTTIW
ncbi:hypothetical protein [Humibacillus xanthopallidus]|uniref:hypothetical protein n=1 Tax=Humibacillus xanthopallidus TaxID=412689 RepID=UPI00163AD883|nr:hypothetical protein [Humibacillus xanthopallidus]